MSTEINELHNQEDAGNLMDSVLVFAGLILVVAVIGIIFWVAV